MGADTRECVNQGRVRNMNHGVDARGVRESGQGSGHESWGRIQGSA